jgi:hypothetical protein
MAGDDQDDQEGSPSRTAMQEWQARQVTCRHAKWPTGVARVVGKGITWMWTKVERYAADRQDG